MVDNKLAEKGAEKGGGPVPAPGPGSKKTRGAFYLVPSISFLFKDGRKGQDAAKAFERSVLSKGLGGFRLLAYE